MHIHGQLDRGRGRSCEQLTGTRLSHAIDFADVLAGAVVSRNARLLERLPWRNIASYVESLEAERSLEGLAEQAVASLERMVPYDFAFSVVTNKTDIMRTRLFLHRHAPSRLLREYFEVYAAIDPAIGHIPSTLRGEVNWEGNESEFTRGFLARYGVGQSVFISNLAQSDEQGFVLVLHRRLSALSSLTCTTFIRFLSSPSGRGGKVFPAS